MRGNVTVEEVGPLWKQCIDAEIQKQYFIDLAWFVYHERQQHNVFPSKGEVLTALKLTHLEDVKVVIIGQDPYHGVGQAQGLAFSVPNGIAIPPSLKNIYKEIDREYNCGIPESGNLVRWANQGVLLLNTVLTVRENNANSHAGHGWEEFTDALVREVATKAEHPIVFMLWGAAAQKKIESALNACETKFDHLILKSSHPSPLSARRGFYTGSDGCNHFKQGNEFLARHGIEEIIW